MRAPLGLLAGVILVALVWWVLRELAKAHGGHHAPDGPAGGGGVDPAPEPDPSKPGPAVE